MGFLDSLNKNAAGIGAASSLGSAVLGGIAGVNTLINGNRNARANARFQQQLQMELMDKQQQYAQNNAKLDYERQRELVRDNASLQKAGQRDAGLSTAGDYGSGAASVSPVSSPSAPSAPSLPDPNAMSLQAVNTIQASTRGLLDASSINAESRLKNSQSELNEIDSLTRAVKNIGEIRSLAKNTESTELKNKYQKIENDILDQYGKMNADSLARTNKANADMAEQDSALHNDVIVADLDEKIANINYILSSTDVKKAERDNLLETRKNLIVERRKIQSDIDVNKSQTYLNYRSADLANQNAIKLSLENVINGDPDIGVMRYNAELARLRNNIRYGEYPDDKTKMALRIIDEYFDQPISLRKEWLINNAARFASYGVAAVLGKKGELIKFSFK